MTNNNLDKTNNLTTEEWKTLKEFCQNRPFKILICDKNVGLILILK